ncbi:MAG: hypothetical protein IKP53_08165 [Candidatus Methanomethylophilaceae archaeon]|jgi:hypothetical protein|nr:hypothetical protein [Candidatus Methanomethylophilaceae archaeon]
MDWMQIGMIVVVLAALVILLPFILAATLLAFVFLPATLVIAGIVLYYYGRTDLGLICIVAGIALAVIGMVVRGA